MEIQWWRILERGGLTAVADAPEAAADEWRESAQSFWADVRFRQPEELGDFLARIQSSEAVRGSVLEMGEQSRIVALPSALFFEFPVHQAGGDRSPTELGCLCLDRLVVTLHRETIPVIAQLSEEGNSRPTWTTLKTTSTLVAAMILTLSTESIRLASSLKQSLRALEERMDLRTDDVGSSEILKSKRDLRSLDTVVDEQAVVFDLLRMVETPFLDLKGLPAPFETVLHNCAFAERAVDRMEKQLVDLQQRYDAVSQEKMNQRLAVLTVISAIFLPLTLLTGIYGMNFDVMPELHHSYAYPIALAAMAAIAGGLYWYFRSKGWLDG